MLTSPQTCPIQQGACPGPHRATRLLKCGGTQGAEFKCKCLTSGWEAVAAPHPPHHPACGWQASQSTSTAQSTVAFQGPAGGIWAPAISLLAGRASSALALIVYICSKRQASAVGHLGPRSSGGAGCCGYTWTSPFSICENSAARFFEDRPKGPMRGVSEEGARTEVQQGPYTWHITSTTQILWRFWVLTMKRSLRAFNKQHIL